MFKGNFFLAFLYLRSYVLFFYYLALFILILVLLRVEFFIIIYTIFCSIPCCFLLSLRSSIDFIVGALLDLLFFVKRWIKNWLWVFWHYLFCLLLVLLKVEFVVLIVYIVFLKLLLFFHFQYSIPLIYFGALLKLLFVVKNCFRNRFWVTVGLIWYALSNLTHILYSLHVYWSLSFDVHNSWFK